MFVDLIDSLRCPRPHEEAWLVLAAGSVADRNVVEGTLGCPVCRSEYAIRNGVVWFDDAAPAVNPSLAPPEETQAPRVAAVLDLSDARGFALLCGRWGTLAAAVRDIVPTHIIALNTSLSVAGGSGISVVHVDQALPLGAATCRGLALDESHVGHRYLDAAARVLRPGGRLLMPATVKIPNGFVELARDDHISVSELRTPPAGIVSLQQRRSDVRAM